ncbi:MAG TPA: hypothetical protein PKY56_07770 [Candidatus Kapabacteria bacterium]|nr:hypothetical protein [Candidatus Kapabacteria bacterium]HPO61457.1 hypothetical protein [Candidatus Kapabacteria bacterium]
MKKLSIKKVNKELNDLKTENIESIIALYSKNSIVIKSLIQKIENSADSILDMKYDEIIKLISGISKSLSEAISSIEIFDNLKSKFQFESKESDLQLLISKDSIAREHLNAFWERISELREKEGDG